MITITEILLNGRYDATNTLLEKFEHNNVFKINKYFDFSEIFDEGNVNKLIIEYVDDDEICYEQHNLVNNKLLKPIILPKSSKNNLFSIFIDKINPMDLCHLEDKLLEKHSDYNTFVVFCFSKEDSLYNELYSKFDESYIVYVNEHSFDFKLLDIEIPSNTIAHCYWYTPYFINKLCFQSCGLRPYIVYYINQNNTSIINAIPNDYSTIIRFSAIDVMENLKKYMMVEHSCIEVSSVLSFENDLMMLLYKNYFKHVIGTKIIKKNYIEDIPKLETIKEDNKYINNDVVLIASTQYPRYGGAATCAYELHKYLVLNNFNSVMVFFDNNIISKNIDIDPDDVGNVYHFKLSKQPARHSILITMKQFYEREDIASKIEHICGNKKPNTILAFNYLAPIIMRILFPVSKVYFLITGSKVLSQLENKLPVTELHNKTFEMDYMEKMAMSCSTLTIPNSGISKNIFEHVYPYYKHKFGTTWDMFEIFGNEEEGTCKTPSQRIIDLVFVCSRYDREIKNVALIKDLFEHPDLKRYNKACIGLDSQNFIKEREDIVHFGFLRKEDIESVLQKCKILLIPSFMESYSITNREAHNNGCISIVTANIGNVYNMHKMFFCESVDNTYEWIEKINLILDNYEYCRHIASKTYYDRSVKAVDFLQNLQNQPLSDTYKDGKKNILICSVDLPYLGGSGTNSYNILKHLNKLNCFNVCGIYFANSNQKGMTDPDNLGNIHRLDINNINDMQFIKFSKTIPVPDIIFCKNYKILYALRCVFPKTTTIYSPSGLRYLTHMISIKPKFLRDIDLNDTKVIMDIKPTLESELKKVGIIDGMKKHDISLDTYALLKCDLIVPNSSITYDILASCENEIIKEKLYKHISLTNISLEGRVVDRAFKKRKYDIGFISHSWKRVCKNMTLMLDIIKACPKLKCLIIGNDLKNELLPSNTTYIGHADHNVLLNHLKTIKSVVMCSYYDSNPNTVIESIMQGCNVVISPNVGGYVYINPAMVVEKYSILNEWVKVIENSVQEQFSYTGPGSDEIKNDIVELLNYTSFKNNLIDKNTCVGIYKIPALLDERFTLSARPSDYTFKYHEELTYDDSVKACLMSDIYFSYTVEIADDNKYSTVHYISEVDSNLTECVFYNMNKYYPVYTKRVFLWKVRNIYDIMNFKGAGLYFLRGTYHTTYGLLLKDNKDCISICYPATSVPFDMTNLRINPAHNILETTSYIKQVTKAKYTIVLSNVDKNNYDKQYPDTVILPFIKFAPEIYYLTNANNERYNDFIFVANATQSTKNHHLFHSFVLYVAKRCKNSSRSFKFVYVGDMNTVRKNYDLPSFGLYPSSISFENINNIDSNGLRELYNNSKVNLMFSGRDAVPRVIFESSACGCYTVCLDSISDGKYFFENPILGSLVGITNSELVKRPSKSAAYKDTDELWKLVYDAGSSVYDHVKIATTYADTFSLKNCVDAVRELLV